MILLIFHYFVLASIQTVKTSSAKSISKCIRPVGWLEFNVPFQHKYGYITDDLSASNG